MTREKRKIFITKYALSDGITEGEYEIDEEKKYASSGGWGCFFFKPDWHDSLSEAKEQAEKMRLKKIKSLNKQLDRLMKLRF